LWFGGETNQRNNAVRRAALNYEIDTRGPADELLVDFGLLEWRDDLGFAAGRTVWLSPVARDEFLVERNPECTYIYLHAPIEAGETATIEVTRGGPTATTSHRLTLYASAGAWQVVGDEPLQ
jgi:hypothetical protein